MRIWLNKLKMANNSGEDLTKQIKEQLFGKSGRQIAITDRVITLFVISAKAKVNDQRQDQGGQEQKGTDDEDDGQD